MTERKEINMFTQAQILIFDMDGTLYTHDGVRGTFKNSSLNRAVIANSVRFVMERELCAKPEAEDVIQEALSTDTIGISNFLANRYGITRANYFDIAWNINPEGVVKNFETQQRVIKQLSKSPKRLFLLTGAPRVWMENVLRFLGLESDFDRKFNGEMFGNKTEIFESLSKEFDPGKILSIGDQFESDLKPAAELGMQILEVKNPDDLKRLL